MSASSMKLRSANSRPGNRVPLVTVIAGTVGVGVLRAAGGVAVGAAVAGCAATAVGTGVLVGRGVAVADPPQAAASNRITISGRNITFLDFSKWCGSFMLASPSSVYPANLAAGGTDSSV